MSQPISIRLTEAEVLQAAGDFDSTEYTEAVIRLILYNRGLDIYAPYGHYEAMDDARIYKGVMRSSDERPWRPFHGELEREQPPELA